MKEQTQKVDTGRRARLGKWIERLLDPELPVARKRGGGNRDSFGTAGLKEFIKASCSLLELEDYDLSNDLVYSSIEKLPERLPAWQLDFQVLSEDAGLTMEEATVFEDVMMSLAQLKGLMQALLHVVHGDAEKIDDLLKDISDFTQPFVKKLVYVDQRFKFQLTLPSGKFDGFQVLPLTALAAQMFLEFLSLGGSAYFKPCAHCGKVFYSTRIDSKTCSGSCRALFSVATRRA